MEVSYKGTSRGKEDRNEPQQLEQGFIEGQSALLLVQKEVSVGTCGGSSPLLALSPEISIHFSLIQLW